ncbi:MAG: class III extradiol ring-cleavage dioxygenase, partial [Candidatus Limnocylindrales bacterium]
MSDLPSVATSTGRLPALYLGHGAPPLLEDAEWPGQLKAWAARLPRPKSILIVSAHWQSAPTAISATTPVPLVYDFYGFPQHYYELTYDAPGAPELAATVKALMPANEPVIDRPQRGLDHGAWVPLMAMYPDHDIPVLQMSMPDLAPQHLFEIGQRLSPLRDEGVLVIGSGFMTHGLPFIRDYLMGKPGAPEWSIEFDRWAAEALTGGDMDALFDFRTRAPGMPYA